MNIKRATIEDAPAILNLQRVAYQSEAQIYNDFDIPPLTQKLNELESEFQRAVFLKAQAKGQIIGSVKGHQEQDTGFIERLIVHPDFQGQGYGKKLMEQIELCFGEVRRFELFTGHKSERNIRLYEWLGYSKFKVEEITPSLSFVFLEKRVQ